MELVKTRAYGGEEDATPADSARATLALALSVQLRLLAPFLPFVTEEVWRWWQVGSIHRAPWPTGAEFGEHRTGDPSVLEVAADVLAAVRRAKTTEKRSMRSGVAELTVSGPAATLAAVDAARRDIVDAGSVDGLQLIEADQFSVAVTLAEGS